MRLIKIIILLFLLLPVHVLAETIVFKSGRIIEGKVTKKTERGITVDTTGLLAAYSLDEIESIDGKDAEAYTLDLNSQEEKDKIVSRGASIQGTVYLESQMYDEAIAEFDKAIAIDPNFSEAYYNRGLAYSKKGNLDKAISDYSKAIQINPQDGDAYFNRALAYYKKNDLGKAISDYTRAIQIGPDIAAACYNRALAYFLKQEYDKAWDDVHQAEALGHIVNVDFIEILKNASGRKK